MFFKPSKLFFVLLLCLVSNSISAQEVMKHTVVAGETKYKLSRQYHISIEDLEAQNPQIVSGLKTGQVLTITNGVANSAEQKIDVLSKFQSFEASSNANGEVSQHSNGEILYKIANGDTKYSVAKRFNLSVEELDRLNPSLGNSFHAESNIILHKGNSEIATTTIYKTTTNSAGKSEENEAEVENEAEQQVSVNRKATIEQEEVLVSDNLFIKNLSEGQHKKIGFIYSANFEEENPEFAEFYKGAMLAIDSLKSLGITVEEHTANAMALTSGEIANLSTSDLFISTADVFGVHKLQNKVEQHIPVVYGSPVLWDTTEKSKAYFALPPNDFTQRMLLDYLTSQNGNVIVVNGIDATVKPSFITDEYPEISQISTPENGVIEEKTIVEHLKEGTKNFIVLNTERSNTILNVTNALLHNYSKFNTELASFLTVDFLNDDNVSNKRFEVLKMIYPKMESVKGSKVHKEKFFKKFKSKYNLEPSEKAIIGFDVTFDAVLRLSQNQGFEETLDVTSEGLQLIFDYSETKQPNEYINQNTHLYQLNNGKEVQLK
ncbi:LysM domain-containing protein [Pustulibacterium marinum]|uniref:LysM domain-containing protein n=1 Tax=Pustulibacterium marinum TaxID=1224947 RepID=A0A1I7G238_9FLAO|nr:LysM domain-containing protein [Pustulibacterium marinum]SFU42528.1 LysM domain-containing protein [Pustulibacterium marinum]